MKLIIAAKIIVVLGTELIVTAAVLFYGAGTVDWRAGWIFLAIVTGSVIPAAAALLIHDPVLLDSRTKLTPKSQPLADQVFVPAHTAMILVWVVSVGYDSVRLNWSYVPMGLRVAAALFIPVATWLGYQTMRQNPYLATCVCIQHDRGHEVIDAGGYAIVRHPFYAVTIAFQISASLLLGSWLGVMITFLITGMIAVRVTFEERHLELNLPSYGDYKNRTRWRLFPGVW